MSIQTANAIACILGVCSRQIRVDGPKTPQIITPLLVVIEQSLRLLIPLPAMGKEKTSQKFLNVVKTDLLNMQARMLAENAPEDAIKKMEEVLAHDIFKNLPPCSPVAPSPSPSPSPTLTPA